MRKTAAILALLAAPALISPGSAQDSVPAINEHEARAIAVEAYLYFYPLVLMDLTRRQATNVEPGKISLFGPANRFSSAAEYPAADFKGVVRPNFDTLYSSAFVDMTKEPVVVSVPDTGGRYYLLPMLDMWTDVFASPGWRTTGTQAANFLITPPGWSGTVPAGMTRIDAPTPLAWIIGRTKTDGPADYDAVHKIQAGYKVSLLSDWGKPPRDAEVKIDPTVDMKTPPKTQADAMPPGKYFAYAAELLKVNPPHLTDQATIARLRRVGIDEGKSFDLGNVSPMIKEALEAAPEAAQTLMSWKMATVARVANHWSMNTDTMGVYGNYYLKRALIAREGLGANQPEDAIYPINLGDEDGQPLNGASKYTLHLEKGAMPPAGAFWSVTLYDEDGFQVANSLNRFALSSWMPFKQDADGGLTLYFQNESPGKDREVNWLPAPKGPFNLTMRLYAPDADALNGKWNPPAIVKASQTVGLTAQ
jgi:hypothetical protein